MWKATFKKLVGYSLLNLKAVFFPQILRGPFLNNLSHMYVLYENRIKMCTSSQKNCLWFLFWLCYLRMFRIISSLVSFPVVVDIVWHTLYCLWAQLLYKIIWMKKILKMSKDIRPNQWFYCQYDSRWVN